MANYHPRLCVICGAEYRPGGSGDKYCDVHRVAANRAVRKDWESRNKKKRRAYQNTEKHRAASRRWKARNPEKTRIHQRTFKARHRGEILAYGAAYRERNRVGLRVAMRQVNLERRIYMRMYGLARRARKRLEL